MAPLIYRITSGYVGIVISSLLRSKDGSGRLRRAMLAYCFYWLDTRDAKFSTL